MGQALDCLPCPQPFSEEIIPKRASLLYMAPGEWTRVASQ